MNNITQNGTMHTMSNETKQTALDWYINELEKYEKGESEYYSTTAIQNHARRMEETQMIMFPLIVMGKYRNGDVLAKVSKYAFNETYGGNK